MSKSVLFKGKTPVQVDGVPHEAERSVDGTLHFKPDTVEELTDDEWAYLQTSRPDLKKQLVLLRSN